MKDEEPRPYFTDKGEAELHRMIAEARFNRWKKWVEMLVPILSMIVAILAFLKK